MTRIDLNADVAEGFLLEESLMPHLSSCNIACGGHAGNIEEMERVVKLALQHGVKIGAHPSYPDRPNFGRKAMVIPQRELYVSLIKQMSNLEEVALEEGSKIQFVKAHGALYHECDKNAEVAETFLKAVHKIDPKLPVLGFPGSVLEMLCRKYNVMFIPEGFADRRYKANGKLVPRTSGEALLQGEEVAKQIEFVVNKGVLLSTDGPIPVKFSSLCFHGDHPQAVENLHLACETLKKLKVEVKSFLS